MRKKSQLSNKELRQKYNRWFKNFSKGTDEILNLSPL